MWRRLLVVCVVLFMHHQGHPPQVQGSISNTVTNFRTWCNRVHERDYFNYFYNHLNYSHSWHVQGLNKDSMKALLVTLRAWLSTRQATYQTNYRANRTLHNLEELKKANFRQQQISSHQILLNRPQYSNVTDRSVWKTMLGVLAKPLRKCFYPRVTATARRSWIRYVVPDTSEGGEACSWNEEPAILTTKDHRKLKHRVKRSQMSNQLWISGALFADTRHVNWVYYGQRTEMPHHHLSTPFAPLNVSPDKPLNGSEVFCIYLSAEGTNGLFWRFGDCQEEKAVLCQYYISDLTTLKVSPSLYIDTVTWG